VCLMLRYVVLMDLIVLSEIGADVCGSVWAGGRCPAWAPIVYRICCNDMISARARGRS